MNEAFGIKVIKNAVGSNRSHLVFLHEQSLLGTCRQTTNLSTLIYSTDTRIWFSISFGPFKGFITLEGGFPLQSFTTKN